MLLSFNGFYFLRYKNIDPKMIELITNEIMDQVDNFILSLSNPFLLLTVFNLPFLEFFQLKIFGVCY